MTTSSRKITGPAPSLRRGLDQAERSSTLVRELEHLERGQAVRGYGAREELEVSKEAARRLLPDIRVMGEALAGRRRHG